MSSERKEVLEKTRHIGISGIIHSHPFGRFGFQAVDPMVDHAFAKLLGGLLGHLGTNISWALAPTAPLGIPAMRNKWYAHSSRERNAAKATKTYQHRHFPRTNLGQML